MVPPNAGFAAHRHRNASELSTDLAALLSPGANLADYLDDLWQCPTCRRAAMALDATLEWLQLDEPLAFEELRVGEARYDTLMAAPPTVRRRLLAEVGREPRDASWGLLTVLLAQVHQTQDLAQARELGDLALRVADRLSGRVYGEARVADMRARAQAALADVERRQGCLEAAEGRMALARIADRKGTGRASGFLDALEADLLEALGRPTDAASLRQQSVDPRDVLRQARRRLEARLVAARSGE